ncbi:MAG: ABC transporter ATP-binding protein [Micropruina sp.]|nr:ABC transporter ATP-binding protein [Micropruina sp.]
MITLIVRGVSKAFPGVKALDHVDLDAPAGSLVAVLGPSGCGKTTLLRCIAGFERADAGRITVAGRVVALEGMHLPSHRRGVGVVPQEGALFPHLSVADNVGFGLPGGRRNSERRATVDRFLELVGLGGLGERMPHELSGGQQQRVALARTLAPGPELVLLDEPFSALDAGLRTELRRDVKDVLRDQGMTAVLVTHDQSEALSMADHVVVMRDGRVIQSGTPIELYTHPNEEWVATFLGDASWLDGDVHGGRFDSALGALDVVAATPSGSARALVRPEQVELDASGAAAEVVRADFHGHDALLTLRLASGAGALVQCRLAHPGGAASGRGCRPGQCEGGSSAGLTRRRPSRLALSSAPIRSARATSVHECAGRTLSCTRSGRQSWQHRTV